MKKRFSLVCRGHRNGTFYCYDSFTGKRSSLGTKDCDDAEQIVQAKNQALRQPAINLQIAKAYLTATDPQIATRTWQNVMDAVALTKHAGTLQRWNRAMREKPFDTIRNLKILETTAEHFLQMLNAGTISTNIFLRRLHNFALDMNWLLAPLIPRRQWPKIEFAEKRGIKFEEHERILQAELNPSWRAYYELLWHLGGSQSDIASLAADNIQWEDQTIAFSRMKTGSRVMFHFGEAVAQLLRTLPSQGHLFPHIAGWKESDRAKAFIRRCKLAGVSGISLHSYRYAWAERAKTAGYPERFAQEALGHSSKAVHRAYAKKAAVKLPPLEDYENKIVQLPNIRAL